MADQLLEQRIQLQQDYIKDLEKNYQDLREFKHDYQNLLFSMNSYLEEGILTDYESIMIKISYLLGK